LLPAAAIRDGSVQSAGNQVDFHADMVGATAVDSFMLHRVGLNVVAAASEEAAAAAKAAVAAKAAATVAETKLRRSL
jgi:hypothetical protein